MNQAELKRLLKAGEWNDIEFKEARAEVPKSAFETVSVFANTHGGWLVFGVAQHGEEFQIVGVEKTDKVQNDFLSALHADGKINHDVTVTEQRVDVGGKTILIFRIDENLRTRKPLYLDGDIRRSFLRKGGGDYRAQARDIERKDNIIEAWNQLVSKYKFFMPKPFQNIDPVTLGRRDDPPGFRVFREAAVNLLIHQDYGDHSRKAVIKFFRDGIQFWNPGDVFGDDSRLFEPGEKEVRNPAIVMGMRRIALCEQAGTGMRMMREEWQKLGHPAPVYKNDRGWKAFEFFIPELDREVDMASDLLKAMFTDEGQDETEARLGRESIANEATGQAAGQATGQATEQVEPWIIRVLSACLEAKKSADIQRVTGIRHRETFQRNYLDKLLEQGLLVRTIPDKPKSPLQRYQTTDKGRTILRR